MCILKNLSEQAPGSEASGHLCAFKTNKSRPASWGKLAEGGLQGVVHESKKGGGRGRLDKNMVATVGNFAPGPSRE